MTLEKIKKVVAEQTGMDAGEVQMSSGFKEDLGIDSIDIIEIIMELEEVFAVEIPTEDLENMEKVEDIVNYINTKLESQE